MNNLKIIILTIVTSMFFSACSGVNFLGAQKWVGGGIYVERWYLKPEYDKDNIPKGTAFYGASADKIKNKFTIKYYIDDDKDSLIEIPLNDMWKIHHNGKDFRYQDDYNLFYYVKDSNNTFRKKRAIHYSKSGNISPIKKCYSNGWCRLYRSYDFEGKLNETLYVKKSILYQGLTILNEKEKKDIELWTTKATTAISPWITPTKQICEKYDGKINKLNVCQAKWRDAKKICKDSGGRLPTMGELKDVIVQCGGKVGGWKEYGTYEEYSNFKYDSDYISCYRKKGFAFDASGYYSSNISIPKYDVTPEDIEMVYISSGSARGISSMYSPSSFLCIETELQE